ncbi:hypothetical protein T4E_11058 [Trichinella pseudospiralis]|uniref:Uncharacterized protein n=1 Tax=Trichinella pseudospiralis TaxID=6337 RepID=A0A0V0YFT9_TRIPS|nr:hypothetical protein T4E_11058 [Trichinella pseudospiralis]
MNIYVGDTIMPIGSGLTPFSQTHSKAEESVNKENNHKLVFKLYCDSGQDKLDFNEMINSVKIVIRLLFSHFTPITRWYLHRVQLQPRRLLVDTTSSTASTVLI